MTEFSFLAELFLNPLLLQYCDVFLSETGYKTLFLLFCPSGIDLIAKIRCG